MDLVFEELLPAFAVTGSADVFEGVPEGLATNVHVDHPWGVHFDWTTTGALNYIIGGSWELRVYLEAMGGAEFTLPNAVFTENFVAAPHHYVRDIVIPGNVVPEGVYKIVAALTMKGPSGIPGPIAAFGEGPMMQFYRTPL